MNKRILNSISGPERADHVDMVLKNFRLETTDQTGLDLQNVRYLFSDAEACLIRDFAALPQADYSSHFAVTKLGIPKKKKNMPADEKAIYKMARHGAQILSAYGEDIAFTVVSRKQSFERLETSFVISGEMKDEEPLASMLRSAYGKVELRRERELPVYPIRLYAAGTMAFAGKRTEQKDPYKTFSQCESWLTALLTALPSGGGYTATVRFVPVTDHQAMKRRCAELSDIGKKLRFYSDLNWSNSVNMGISRNEGMNILDGTIGKDTNGHTSGYTLNLSGREINKEAALLADRIDYELQWLKQAMASCAWAVEISISAEDMDTIQTVTSVLSGTMAEADVLLKWSQLPAGVPLVLGREEVLPLMLLPTKEFSGFSFSENEEFSLVSPGNQDTGVRIGNILWNGTPFTGFYLSPDLLNRHAFICGMTGSGKSNTMFGILMGVDLPFCVIEPVKGEYRALRSVYPDLDIWTMKADTAEQSGTNVMRINPFWFPRGGNLAYHVDSLKTLIASCFELSNAMPNILEQCLYNIYVKAGWDLVTNRNIYWGRVPEKDLYPTFSDLCSEVEYYLDHSDFSGDLMGDYKGALLSRLRSFVNGYKGILLNTNEYPDYHRLMNGHCVIELESLADDADKCLVMGTVLIQYYQVLKQNFRSRREGRILNHILVVEEAHRLFKNTDKTKRSEGGADPTGQLVDLLSNMMAEIRAFGEGMLIVDQSPTKIAEDVIKNSATKMVHRIDNGNDIKVLQSALLLPEDILSFASLRQGEALVRVEGMEKPCKVKMLHSSVKDSYDLVSSFRMDTVEESPLADVFLANSILQNERLGTLVRERVDIFVNSMMMTGMKYWFELVRDLMVGILDALKLCRVSDAVDYRMNVLFEMVSITLKRMYIGKNKYDLGMIHMFTMRLLDFFRDQKMNGFMKPGAIDMLQRFLEEKLSDVLRYNGVERIGDNQHRKICDMLEIDPEETVSIVLSNYIQDILPAVEDRGTSPSADYLLNNFLSTTVSFCCYQDALDQVGDLFDRVPECLEKLIS